MFSLIISIVSIALIVAVTAATMYYGGDGLSQGRATAEASAYVTAAQQIGGAATMHAATQPAPATTVDQLVTSTNLSGIPNVKSRVAGTNEWTIVPAVAGTSPRMLTINLAGTPSVNERLCHFINAAAGATGMDANNGTIAALATFPYACVAGATGTDPQVFQFKF